MDISQQKTDIEKSIVEELLQQIDAKKITLEESMIIAKYCIEKLKAVSSAKELELFLSLLSTQHPIFKDLLALEKVKKNEDNKDEIVEKIVTLTKDGKLDEALTVAKDATNN